MKNLKILILLIFISVASSSAVIITPALPQISSDLGLIDGSVEWLVNMFLIGYTIGQIVYSPIASKYGDIFALRLGLFLNVLGVLICILGVINLSYSLLLIGRFLTALGSSAGFVCTFIILKRLTNEQQMKTALAFVPVSFALGIGLATLTGGVVAYHISWSYCFYILLVQGIIMLGLTLVFKNENILKSEINVKAIFNGYKLAFKDKNLVIFAFCLGLAAAFNYCYTTAGGFISQETLQINIAEYGYWNSLTIIGIIAGGLACTKIINKFDTFKMLLIIITSVLICLIILAIFTFTNNSTALVFFSIATILYFITSFIFPTASSLALSKVKNPAYASGAMSFINIMTAMVSVAIMGHLPFASIWNFITICSFVCIVCLGLAALGRQKKI